MKNKKYILLTLVGIMFVFGTAYVYAASSHSRLYTLSGFVDLLISKGITKDDSVEKAHELTKMIEASENQNKGINADKVEVSVSQLIKYGSLTYEANTDIEGLLFLIKNKTNEDITLEAKRGCQVIYKIYDINDNLVYDSSAEEKCQTNEHVTYKLKANKTRIFEIKHPESAYKLKRGTYKIEMEYPEYGKGEKTIVIQ